MDWILSWTDFIVWVLSVPVTLAYFVFGLDDLLIDLSAWVFDTRPELLDEAALQALERLPEKKLAVLVAAWHEGDVLKDMILGNLRRIRYTDRVFFVGVYPNDPGTLAEAEELRSLCPDVRVVVNRRDGPTSKGQMLNEIVRAALRSERDEGVRYEGFVIHDAEDVIHPDAFRLMNRELERHDLVQIPVFSLPLPATSLVAGTYIDEFSECHTKDLLVRDRLGVAIPSAGVGTALSRRLVEAYLEAQDGNLLNPEAQTEDYELGVSTQRYGLSSRFACYFRLDPRGRRDYVATREYFPKSFRRSVRQKARWTLGIAFQSAKRLGWQGTWLHRYFLYRDRKGPYCSLLVALGAVMFVYTLERASQSPGFLAQFPAQSFLVALSVFNAFFMLNRIAQRALSVAPLYGVKLAALSPLRLPLSNAINALAAARAVKQYLRSRIFGVVPGWVKTEHEIPLELRAAARGIDPEIESKAG